ncbi:hypothetical protein [Gracilimonas mengyeensis]|uniref:Uncharacterized protein n=1 Tax=Gracilimonas mengyeensis TaxID=1302730 RepID=A0A521C370_9BACT|nr:hypothetical protein [Gracilimonas mengyeensis]SMO53844.1 hypothetical protein SAMN06265219_104111 [Gracilimonas mengyeensis]
MTDEEKDLNELINNESFLRWLRGTSSSAETKKWQNWHAESVKNWKLTRKAKKIISMPFNNPEIPADEEWNEKDKFDKHFLRLIKYGKT